MKKKFTLITQRSLIAILCYVYSTNNFAFFNFGIDVDGRILEHADTYEARYAILGSSSGASIAKLPNPVKKIDVYAEPTSSRSAWGSVIFKLEFDCRNSSHKFNKFEYFTERKGKGQSLPPAMIFTQRDIINHQLPAVVISKVYSVACVG